MHGDPLTVLKLGTAPMPTLANDELLVRMIERPINPYELAIIAGEDGDALKEPQVPGFEGVGIVENLGNQTLFKKGQRVIPMPVDLPGTWQELVKGKTSQFMAVPDDITDIQAALILNPLTCLIVLREMFDIRKGQWLLNTAASTNIGRLLIQFAEILNFNLISVVRNGAAEAEVKALGARRVINTEKDDLIASAKTLTDGLGVHGVIDPVGGETGSAAAKTLRFGGKMLLFSDMSKYPVSLDPMEFITKKLTVAGYTSLHWLNENSYERKAAFIGELFDIIRSGKLVLEADEYFPLEDFANAITRSKASGRKGKTMLK